MKLGVCVPYRNREAHLKEFVPRVGKFLEEKGIEYCMYFGHQVDDKLFNRGAMKNIAAEQAAKAVDSLTSSVSGLSTATEKAKPILDKTVEEKVVTPPTQVAAGGGGRIYSESSKCMRNERRCIGTYRNKPLVGHLK
jgi:hypothetical protein